AEIRVPNVVSWTEPIQPPPPSLSEVRKSLNEIPVPRLPAPKVPIASPMPATPKLEANANLSALPIVPMPEITVPSLPIPVKLSSRQSKPPDAQPQRKPGPVDAVVQAPSPI